MTLLVLLLSCDGGGSPDNGTEISASEAEAAAEALLEAQDAAPPPPPTPDDTPSDEAGAEIAELAQVVLIWESISPLYKGFFSDTAAVTDLAEGLGPWLESPVDMTVRYNTEESVGDLIIKLRPDQLRMPIPIAEDTVNLQAMAPITTAMARYRSDLAARFDFRIESFRISVESYRGAHLCQLTLAGTPPPDGRLINPCVTVNGISVCGVPSASGVTFPADTARDLATCLDLD